MKKFISVTMSLVIFLLPLLSGCGKKAEEEPAAENVVATVGDYEITDKDLDFYLSVMASTVQSQIGNAEGWQNTEISDGVTAGDYVIEQALDAMHMYCIFRIKAAEAGVYSSEDEEAFVSEQMADGSANYGYDESALRNYFAGVGALYAIAKSNVSEEEAKEIFDRDYMTVKHILFQFEQDGSGEDDTNTLAKANAAYKRAVGGESFESLINELNEDTGEDPESGYTFTEGEMVDEFYQASKNLAAGEISEPVRTSYGYHIIKRYPLPEEGTETYDTYIENLRLENGTASVENDIEEWKKQYELKKVGSKIDNIDLSKYTTKDNYADASVFNETQAD